MPVFDIFSKRNSEPPKGEPQKHLPLKFRRQVIHILNDSLGIYRNKEPYALSGRPEPKTNEFWEIIRDSVSREHGDLPYDENPKAYVTSKILNGNLEEALDAIELSFRFAERIVSKISDFRFENAGLKQWPKESVKELNQRFKEHNIAYRYEDGIIIEVESEFTYKEMIKPALKLIREIGFEGVEDEFMDALSNQRKGETKEAIRLASNAFESTLRAICDKNNWKYSKPTAGPMIETIFENNLLPKETEMSVNYIKELLKNGPSSIGHKSGRHGQGEKIKKVSDFIGLYSIHLTASSIILLIKADKEHN